MFRIPIYLAFRLELFREFLNYVVNSESKEENKCSVRLTLLTYLVFALGSGLVQRSKLPEVGHVDGCTVLDE